VCLIQWIDVEGHNRDIERDQWIDVDIDELKWIECELMWFEIQNRIERERDNCTTQQSNNVFWFLIRDIKSHTNLKWLVVFERECENSQFMNTWECEERGECQWDVENRYNLIENRESQMMFKLMIWYFVLFELKLTQESEFGTSKFLSCVESKKFHPHNCECQIYLTQPLSSQIWLNWATQKI
jgi:hypothetical protein